jgi:hemolysin activation/secretion protein
MSHVSQKIAFLLLPIALGVRMGIGYAQTPPDAGSLQQGIERQLQKPRVPMTPSVPTDEAPAEEVRGQKIVVKGFSFVGNTRFTSEQLNAVLQAYLEKPVTFVQLRMAAIEISDFYRQQGWVAKAFLPKQEIKEGIVIIEIIESKFGAMNRQGDDQGHFSFDLAQHYVDAAQPSGELLNQNQIDRALMLIEDLPGVSVVGSLSPGSQRGLTDLNLRLVDEAEIDNELTVHNTASRSTGAVQAVLTSSFNSPSGVGDQIALNLMKSEGMEFARGEYSRPLGFQGVRAKANLSLMRYDVVADDFAALDLTGDSQTLGVGVSYPIVRGKSSNLYFDAGYQQKDFKNKSAGSVTSDYQVNNLTLTLTGNAFDKFGGGGANLANVDVVFGDVDLGTLESSENSELNGSFEKLRYLVSRQQLINEKFSLYGALNGQLTSDNLDSSEKFFLGGANGVRAYPNNEGGGSIGHMLNLELRYQAQTNLTVTGFYDWGRVKQNADNNIASPASPNRFDLKGVGLAVLWTGPEGISVKGTFARRIGDNPNPTATGNDQDGTLKKNRVWLQASLPF